jgi:hypothetical protein
MAGADRRPAQLSWRRVGLAHMICTVIEQSIYRLPLVGAAQLQASGNLVCYRISLQLQSAERDFAQCCLSAW